MHNAEELAQSIVNRYLTLHRDQRHFSHWLHKQMNISGRQLAVLRYLCQTGPHTVREISQYLYIRDGTTSPMLERMEKGGYVIRTRSTEDNRKVLVAPTDAGRDIISRAPVGVIARMRMELPELPLEQLQSIDRALQTLSEIAKIDLEHIGECDIT